MRVPAGLIEFLGTPDRQALVGQADAYEVLVDRARPLKIAQAPERDDYNVAECEARVLSLDGHWREGRVRRTGFGGWLSFFPEKFCEGGMSGSPIIDMSGKAIGIVSVDLRSPVLVDSLSTGLLRSIRTCLPSLKYRRVSRLLDEAKQT